MTSPSTGSPAGSRWRNRRCAADERGFTLIEILVAFAILAVSLAVVTRTLSDGMRNLSRADAAGIAASLGESLLARVGVERPLAPGERTGKFDNGFTWTTQIRADSDEARGTRSHPPVRAYEVKVTVSWAERGAERSLTLTSLRLGPRR